MAVREGNLNRRIAWNHSQAVVGEMEFRDHLRAKHAGDIRGGGNPAPGSNLFGDATSADDLAALENQSGKTRSSQVGSSG
jgi:hypothetical protein